MGRFRSSGLFLAIAVLSLETISGCGGGTKAGTPLFPGKVNLIPSTNASLVLGSVLLFTGSVQTTSGTTLAVPITFSSSDTSVLNLSPNGVACAGHWDAAFTACTPGSTGAVQVTASALGATSVPTYVFVHPPIDNIAVTGVLLDGVPVQEPCLSQSQAMTLEARAYSNGTDITASVGPFAWSASNPAVVSLTPLVNSAYNFPTNQVTAKAANPGITQIYASASGVSSTSFQQPQYTAGGATSPLLGFFATCPVQSITLELGRAGSGQTSFVAAKGASQTAVATLFDIMGNSTLPNTNGGIVLSKIPLTWTASRPGVLAATSSCTESCALSTPAPGSGTVTASCSPPTCNIGFPQIPASLSTTAQIDACTQFFQPTAPKNFSCQLLIPAPVYSDTAISGVVTGTPATPTTLATSTDCAQLPPSTCTTAIYALGKASAGSETPMPASPNSLLFDLAGDKVYVGSEFGATSLNPGNLGTSNAAFTSLGTVTGKVLAASVNGAIPVIADTVHTPNQVFVGNTPLNIPAAVAAAFSPDGLKTFIVGNSGSSLYVYSPLQALQGPIALSGTANSIAFSPNGAFAYVAEATTAGASANVTAFATCTNPAVNAIRASASVTLPADPVLMRVLPNFHIDGKDSYGNAIPDGVHILILDTTGFDILTSTITPPSAGTVCPQGLTFISGDPLRPAQRIELGQGTLQPINFFASGDATQLYIVSSSSSSIFVYNFIVGAVTGGIELVGNPTPISVDMSVDAGTIVVAGSDGMVHEVSTSTGGADLLQISFPNLPNYLNPFCTYGSCTLNTVLVKP